MVNQLRLAAALIVAVLCALARAEYTISILPGCTIIIVDATGEIETATSTDGTACPPPGWVNPREENRTDAKFIGRPPPRRSEKPRKLGGGRSAATPR